ncbi:hypothetical protein [Pseudarthrobacter sp. LT1]|uniref:hypothetical protein n=1 Tax=Pseudarthrobacter sp. LT1 TaxID=3111450 RepID=UPI002D792E61|nr:hypothetical protein [Pseudarthrobacter sp. LT1]WRT14670.1 hypothetical protein VIK36_04020 [Pseudarthrobacter sp. LT1]
MSEAEYKAHPYAFALGIGTHATVGAIIGGMLKNKVDPCKFYYDGAFYNNILAHPNGLFTRWLYDPPDNPGQPLCAVVLMGPPEGVGTIIGAALGVITGFLLSMYLEMRKAAGAT